MKILTTQEQIAKLTLLTKEADKAYGSDNLICKLGAITTYAALVDVFTIQVARLLEQAKLKQILHTAGKTELKPHEDSYFYDAQITTRDNIKFLKMLLPFGAGGNAKSSDVEKVNKAAKMLIRSVDKFLAYRNTLLHHIGSPKKDISDINELCTKAKKKYEECVKTFREFMESARPFRFSEKEQTYFYKEKQSIDCKR